MRRPVGPRLTAQLLSWLLCISCAEQVAGPLDAPAVSLRLPSFTSAGTTGWPRPDRAHIRIWTTRLPVTLVADTSVLLPPPAGPLP